MREIYTNHLIKLKERTKISFAALEQNTGISASTLCRWFKGEGNPSVDDLERIFEALGSDMREVFAAVGEQEFRAAEKVDYKGADALIADYEERIKIIRENCNDRVAHQIELREKLQESFHASLHALETSHAAALQKRDDTYDRSVGYLKEELRSMHEKNRELMDRAAAAEKRADVAQAQRDDIDKRRHHVFWGMLALCLLMLFVGVCIYPPF